MLPAEEGEQTGAAVLAEHQHVQLSLDQSAFSYDVQDAHPHTAEQPAEHLMTTSAASQEERLVMIHTVFLNQAGRSMMMVYLSQPNSSLQHLVHITDIFHLNPSSEIIIQILQSYWFKVVVQLLLASVRSVTYLVYLKIGLGGKMLSLQCKLSDVLMPTRSSLMVSHKPPIKLLAIHANIHDT